MTLRAWFSCKGRISRKTWWIYYFVVPLVVNVGAVLLDDFVLQIKPHPGFLGEGFVYLPAMSLTALAISLWVTMAGQTKRWHDRGKTGWAVLFTMIPSLLMAAPLLYANRVPEEYWFILLISCLPFIPHYSPRVADVVYPFEISYDFAVESQNPRMQRPHPP